MATATGGGADIRQFLGGSPEWLALRTEDVLEPDLPIVDPHHHLWEMAGSRYLLDDLLADTGSGHRIVATVFVETRTMYRRGGPAHLRSLGETEFANGIAAMSAGGGYGPTLAVDGIVGNVDLRFGEHVRPALEAHLRAAGGRFKGIRNVSAWHADPRVKGTTASPLPGLLLDPDFRRGFAELAPLGLTFDAWLLHTQLADVLDLARAFPDTTIVLDHVGGPVGVGPHAGRRDEVFREWRASIAELAGCPNVVVKLGGLAMQVTGFDFHERDRPPASVTLADAWRPYIETCIVAFRVGRSMFPGNFPVGKGMCPYQSLWNAFKRLAAGCTAAEKAALFAGTAARVYRLDLPG